MNIILFKKKINMKLIEIQGELYEVIRLIPEYTGIDTEKLLKTALDFFEENEEYEKCIIISEKLNRFNHKNNYTKKES